MNYREWVRDELRGLSKSMGFRYIPSEEIEGRASRLKTAMETQGMEAMLVEQKMDLYYLSGTTQDSVLFIPLEGRPLLLVRREVGRAEVESPLEEVVELKSIRELPALIGEHCGRLPHTLGLELDVLPVRDYSRHEDLFEGCGLVDASPLIRAVRTRKSRFEIELMRAAGDIGRKTFQKAREILKEGMTFAVEPKIVFPGEGSVGLENTLVVTKDGYEILTPMNMDIIEV